MRRLSPWLIVLACPLPACAQEAPDRDGPLPALNPDGHTAPVRKVLFRPKDGKELITVSEDKTVVIWDVERGTFLRVLRPPVGTGSLGVLFAAAVSPDGKLLAVAGHHPREGGNPIHVISLTDGAIAQTLVGHPGAGIRALAFSPDGSRLASGGHAAKDPPVLVWDLKTGTKERELKGHTDAVNGLAFDPRDGKRLVSVAADHTGRIWDLTTGKTQATLSGHGGPVYALAWSPDGKTIATGGADDRHVLLWDATRATGGKEVKPRREDLAVVDLGSRVDVFSLDFTPNGRQLLCTWDAVAKSDPVSCDWGGSLVDVGTGKRRVGFHKVGPRWSGPRGALSPDGSLAVTAGGTDHGAFVWKTADIPGPVVKRLAGRAHTPVRLGWAPGAPQLAWGTDDPETGTWPRENPALQQVFVFSEEAFGPAQPYVDDRGQSRLLGERFVDFAPFVQGRGDESVYRVKRDGFELENPTTGQAVTVRHARKVVHPELPNLSPSGLRCATLLADGTVAVGEGARLELFDGRTGKLLHALKGHPGRVLALVSAAKGDYLVGAFADQTLRLWNLRDEEPLLSLLVAGSEWVAWTPEGYYDATPGGERLLGWHVNNRDRNGIDALGTFYAAGEFHNALYRPDVVRRLFGAGSLARRTTAPVTVAELLPPKVVSLTARQEGKSVAVEAAAQGAGTYGVASLRLMVDGHRYKGSDGLVTFDRAPRRAAARWVLANRDLAGGQHEFRVVAQSTVSKSLSAPAPFTSEFGTRDPSPPKLYVLAIGINKYKNPDLELKSAVPDAVEIAKVFQDKDRWLPDLHFERALLVTNDAATKKGILEALDWLQEKMKPKDVAVISYSGHGERDDKGHFALLPVEFDADKFDETTVSGDELKNRVGRLPGKVLVLLDACHSAAIVRSAFADELTRALADDDCGVAVMCAAMSRQTAGESVKVGHGFFTKAVLQGLHGAADYDRDGKIELDELDLYVSREVRKLSKDQQRAGCAKPPTLSFFELIAVPEKK